ncbi:hypothetical protein C8A03DRAFT_16197 [Achaetomium macrosporum]|uniref:Uncharacterized protein n=1 Tax=Achaetomium macrosporum TaxID=79813 RepID=A0AAN7C923_9PEZI|nr:hypothetical protein C8A03DRAFT_16197 [Achaetomium macrosporum]
MFLHSGASLHGHEYSNRPSSNVQIQSPAHLRAPLLRSTFSPPKPRARATSEGTPPPVLHRRPASDYIPRAPSPVVRFREPQDEPPPTPATHDGSISESELSDITLSVDGAAAPRTVRLRRPRRARRKSTTYYLGYPAPRIIGKTKVVQQVLLPRLLLQLQKCGEDGKSQPVLEVFPASRIAGPVVAPRLAKRFPDIFGAKRRLGYDDIVLVRRDDNDPGSDGTESENEENLERRNLLAVYSPLKHSEEAEIVLDNGSVWVAKPLANGSFDFVYTDAERNITTARWARRHAVAVTPTSLSTETSSSSTSSSQARYTFSIINPSTRRHPVMATLTPSTLEVQDTYTSVSSSRGRHPPITRVGRSLSVTSSPSLASYSPSIPSSPGVTSDGKNDSEVHIPSSPSHDSSQRTVHQVDDATKMLISVTALWVALRSGWSQSYNSSKAAHEGVASPGTISQRNRSRRNTWNTRSSTSDAPRPSEVPNGEPSRCASVFKRYSMPAQPPESTAKSPTPDSASRTSTPTSMIAPVDSRPLPRRATSTGAAFMQRHLQASSSLSAPTAPGRAATAESEAEKKGHPLMALPSLAPAPKPPAKTADARISMAGPTPKTENRARMIASPKPKWAVKGEGDGAAVGNSGKKSGVRLRLSRWIHKLGPSR